MAALISILLEMPKGDAMSSSGLSLGTNWATRICKEKNFISRIQVQPHGTRTSRALGCPGRGRCSTVPQRTFMNMQAACRRRQRLLSQHGQQQFAACIRVLAEESLLFYPNVRYVRVFAVAVGSVCRLSVTLLHVPYPIVFGDGQGSPYSLSAMLGYHSIERIRLPIRL